MLFHNIHPDSEKGAVSVYLLMFFLSVVIAWAYHYDTPNAYLTKDELHSTIEVCLQSAGTLSSKDHGYAAIDPDIALTHFNFYLQKNLQLDSNNMPLSTSPLASQVQVIQFNVLNNVPTVDPIKGDIVNEYSIEAVVSTSSKPYLGSLYGGSPYVITDFARVKLKKTS